MIFFFFFLIVSETEAMILRNTYITDLLQWGNIGTSLRWARQWKSLFKCCHQFSNYYKDRDRINEVRINRADTLINRIWYEKLMTCLIIHLQLTSIFSTIHTIEFGTQTIFDISYSFVQMILLVSSMKRRGVGCFYLQDTWEVNSLQQ